MGKDITPGQQEFIAELNKKLEAQFSSQLDGKFSTMNVPNGFYWGIQFGGNNYYNEKALDQVGLQAVIGSNNVLTVADSDFTTLYNSILQNIVYNFSEEDAKKMATEQSNADSQIQAVINSWENDADEKITEEAIKDAGCFPKTKLGYIDYQVEKMWKGDINKIPSSLNSFKVAYQTYQVDCQVSFQLQSASAAAILKLKACRENSLKPTAENGGLQTGSGSFHTAFGPFPTQNKINSGLQTLTNKASVKMALSNFDSKTTNLKIEGSAGISIPVLDFLSIDLGASSSYSLSTYTESNTTVEIEITYTGITFVGAPLTDGNLSPDNSKGWYDNDILKQAISNRDGNRTGYQLLSNQYPNSEYFGPGKIFSRIKTWVIGQEPNVTMKFCSANTNRVESDFKEQASIGIKLFGIFGIGSAKQSYQVSKVHKDTSAGCVTVEMGPSKIIGTTASSDSTAYVVGGVASYPPDDV